MGRFLVRPLDDVGWAGIAGQAVAEASAAEPRVSVPISTEVINDNPSNVRVEASKEADLLVVGGRGHGLVLGMLLGSVSDHCAHHSQCPVVVVPSPQPDAQRSVAK